MPRTPVQISNSPAELATLGLAGGESEFSRSELATVRFLGSNLHRLQRSLALLRARVKNETLSPELCGFLRPILSNTVADAASEVTIEIRWNVGRMRVGYSALPAGFALPLAVFWLPALRSFWERTLRKSHYQRLTRLLPRVWFLTADAPPPGAVIPGLQITSWNQLTPSHGPFWWTQGDTCELLSAAEVLQRADTSVSQIPVILIEERNAETEILRIRASYRSDGERAHLHSLTFLPPSNDVAAS